jgi:agmatinase
MSSLLKKKQIQKFDPNGVGQKGRLFGLPFTPETAEVVVIPVPWDVTASFTDGTSLGPKAILDVSSQIDLYLPNIPNAWQLGISMLPIDAGWVKENRRARKHATEYIKYLEEADGTGQSDRDINLILNNINALSRNINEWVHGRSCELLEAGKIPAVVGGDHSSPLGLMQAVSGMNNAFGVLQIDAHADLRPAYEGFTHSHASIMHNLLELDHVEKLVQLGIRDFCEQEASVMESNPRIVTFFDHELKKQEFEGVSWSAQVAQIIEELPDDIYITVDIDGLEAYYCPGTGTPVPGGLSYSQLIYLFDKIAASGKRILAFDICEVCGNQGQWDAIVGSRILYYLSSITGISNKLLFLR